MRPAAPPALRPAPAAARAPARTLCVPDGGGRAGAVRCVLQGTLAPDVDPQVRVYSGGSAETRTGEHTCVTP